MTTKERLVLIAVVILGVVLAVSVSAVVGAVTYAGWIEPGSRIGASCECC